MGGNSPCPVTRRVLSVPQAVWVFVLAIFLVSVPVFLQAPLVRWLPWVSLLLTGGWLGGSVVLLTHPVAWVWGDLLLGFTGSWWTGSLYWGWMRWEPYLHLPIESLALPLAIWGLAHPRYRTGSAFYLGSLLGTVLTDSYFYIVNLIPYWRQLMLVEPVLAAPIFQGAIARVQTPWGMGWAIVLVALLLIAGLTPLRAPTLPHWAFSGAVLGTILVDGLFLVAACAT